MRVFYNLVSLVELDLKFNRLSSLPVELSSLHKLRRLWLTGNNLQTLACHLSTMPNLDTVYHEWPLLVQPDDLPADTDASDMHYWSRVKFDWVVMRQTMQQLLRVDRQLMSFTDYLTIVRTIA